jgi:hypothetical protein
MKMLKAVVFIVIGCLINSGLSAQKTIDVSNYNCFSSQIKYYSQGKQKEGILLFVNHYDREIPLQYSHVYLLSREHKNIQLAGDSTAFTNVFDLKVSPDNKYLALLAVSEGHPWIEIYDLQALINSGSQNLLAEINPYPGIVNLTEWKGDKLFVESDANLLLKNKAKEIGEEDISSKTKIFSFDIRKKKFSTE